MGESNNSSDLRLTHDAPGIRCWIMKGFRERTSAQNKSYTDPENTCVSRSSVQCGMKIMSESKDAIRL